MARKPSAAKSAAAPARPSNSTLDLARLSVREANQLLHDADGGDFVVKNPRGLHAIAAGLDGDFNVTVDGHVGYYCAGMNKLASITINGNAGTGVAENMMSGLVHVKGDVSQSAGATGCGGLLIADGNAPRCASRSGGLDIVVKGAVGHMSAFMAQAGTWSCCDAGDAGRSDLRGTAVRARHAKSLGPIAVMDMGKHKAALRPARCCRCRRVDAPSSAAMARPQAL
jgi:hypothetical protein